jgi:uracil-DNA glycosylase
MASIKTLGLDALYDVVKEKGRCTPAVFARIIADEDLSQITPRFCDLVCRVSYPKTWDCQSVDNSQADIVVLFAEKSRDGRYRTGAQDDRLYESILDHLLRVECPGSSYKVVYAAKCRPTANAPKITSTALKPCGQYMGREIVESRPKAILATSTEVLKVLGFTKQSVRKNLSEILYWNDIPVIVSLHPKVTTMIRQNASGAFWGDDFYELIRRDVSKMSRVITGEIPRIAPEDATAKLIEQGRIRVCATLKEVEDLCNRLSAMPSTRVISWDTETTGLDPWAHDSRFLCHQFGVREEDGLSYAYVIPLWHRDNIAYDPDRAWPMVANVLMSEVTKVGHHGKFDLKYTKVTTGVDVKNYTFDTLYASHSICSGLQGTYGLKKAVWDWIPESGLGGYEDILQIGEDEDGVDIN